MSLCDPRVCPQLRPGIPTAGEDCGVRTTQRAIRWASCGKVFVKVATIRQRMGKPSGPTNPPDWLAALTHPDTLREFAKAGLQPPDARLRGVSKRGYIIGSPVQTAIDALNAGELVCVAESYAPWTHSQWSGSDTFTGNHAVSYFGLSGDVPGRETTRYDSLADGRRAEIVQGPSVVPWHIVVDAMGELDLDSGNARRPLGHGQWAGMVVKRAVPLKPPPAPPTCEQQLAALQAELDALKASEDDDTQPPADAPVAEGVTAPADPDPGHDPAADGRDV